MSEATRIDDNNPAFGVEQHGFDFIPESERGMTLRDLAFVWVGTNAYLFFFSVGVIAYALGLTVWQALIAVFVGNALFGYVAWASIAGVRAGLPTMTLTRAAFGVQGNRFNGVLAWVTSVSFEALNTVFGVFAVAALLPILGWTDADTAGKIIALVVVFFLSAAIAVLGHATLVYFQRIFAVLLTVVVAVVFFYTLGGVDWGAGPEHVALDRRDDRGDDGRCRRGRLGPALVPLQRLRLAALPAEPDARASRSSGRSSSARARSRRSSASWA